MNIKYYHTNYRGTNCTDCEVLDKSEGKYTIQYFDEIEEKIITKQVSQTDLEFPDFSEYGNM